MLRILGNTAVMLLAILPQALAGSLRVHNTCSFDIWCDGAKNDGKPPSPAVKVSSGQTYVSPKRANNDNIGAVLKCGTTKALPNPYQMEIAVDKGISYLDLSAIDGDPFLSHHRHAAIPGTSCVLDCPAGSTACEYPKTVTCKSQGEVTLTLC
ncbi:hypothetical protein F5Y19DRAFT_480709 [Xylariaceae sp. FL1651]|nr:hypothetical protein F5Y19DRAFT_480709 [Xylariaceae sp. FL1651]